MKNVIGIVDTGIDYNHQDIAGNMFTNPGEIPGNGVDDDANGFIDDVDVNKVRDWETGFHAFAKAQFPQVGDKIRSEKAISKETEAELKRCIAGLAAIDSGRICIAALNSKNVKVVAEAIAKVLV